MQLKSEHSQHIQVILLLWQIRSAKSFHWLCFDWHGYLFRLQIALPHDQTRWNGNRKRVQKQHAWENVHMQAPLSTRICKLLAIKLREPRVHPGARRVIIGSDNLTVALNGESASILIRPVQRWDLFFVRGWVKFIPAPSYLFCLALPGSCLTRSAKIKSHLCSPLACFPNLFFLVHGTNLLLCLCPGWPEAE